MECHSKVMSKAGSLILANAGQYRARDTIRYLLCRSIGIHATR